MELYGHFFLLPNFLPFLIKLFFNYTKISFLNINTWGKTESRKKWAKVLQT